MGFRGLDIREVGVTYEKDTRKCYKISVGCMSFIFIGEDTLLSFINKYVKEPETTERNWYIDHGAVGDSDLQDPL